MPEKQTQTQTETSETFFKCSCTPPPRGKRSRNLVINLDGTSNKYGPKNTNVIELYSHIDVSEDQLKYYNSGIGTSAQPSWKLLSYCMQILDNKIDLAIAWNFEKVLLGAYRWLSEHYKPGDRIFLFGFSRGAFQVRALAGMIEKVGLLYEGNEEQIPFAFELYASVYGEEREQAAKHFKETFSVKDVRVHFIGVWDTVSSIGIFKGMTLPLTDSCDHVCAFRHALALDECRVKFLPECIAGPFHKPFPINAKEVWFSGSHSDVCVCINVSKLLVPLLWMENEALMAGLHFSRASINWKVHDLQESEPTESLSGAWWLLECIPYSLKANHDPAHLSRVPRLGSGRVIYPGQKIHASVAFKLSKTYDSEGEGYYPLAEFWRGTETMLYWHNILGTGPSGEFRRVPAWKDRLEMDLFDFTHLPGILAHLGDKDITDGDASHILNRIYFLTSLSESNSIAVLYLLDRSNDSQTMGSSLYEKQIIFRRR
ncbi:hypothetical protein FIBSPDRAFT_812252 [Athelia psychrophila]|uniref:T6SS Phospholipase effector Tle1-like catalytic domain-containing protein n=2 Tax=Athelia psychrophila TaxID=1759441 RepID=A0A166VFP2_9AGAM|nr:hypothetical protein FIBSPDRAFT_812252 [Fibularhizoctonia sp. CBS 109695]